MAAIRFFLNVCKDKPQVELKGKKYAAGFRGEVELDHVVDKAKDLITLDLTECGHRPRVGGASHVVAFSIRICKDSVTTIAIYDDPMMNAMGCCTCCDNGCCVYGNSDCACV